MRVCGACHIGPITPAHRTVPVDAASGVGERSDVAGVVWVRDAVRGSVR